jgi:hypothetical protein
MNKETLKKWRIFIPGIITVLLIRFGLTNSKEEFFTIFKISKTLELNNFFYILPVLFFGIIYYALNVRWIVWKPFNFQVQENIKNKILNTSNLKLLSSQWFGLKKDRALMNIFYSFVDNNESLKEKSKVVIFNGLIWSSFIDLSVLSCLSALSFSIISIFTSKSHHIYLSWIFFNICFVSLVFTSLLTFRHIKLSNEQLEIITQTKTDEIDPKIQKAIVNL